MSEKKVVVKEVVNYKGHSVKANGSVDLSFSAMYDELTNTIQCLQMLNNDVDIVLLAEGAHLSGKRIGMSGVLHKCVQLVAGGLHQLLFITHVAVFQKKSIDQQNDSDRDRHEGDPYGRKLHAYAVFHNRPSPTHSLQICTQVPRLS